MRPLLKSKRASAPTNPPSPWMLSYELLVSMIIFALANSNIDSKYSQIKSFTTYNQIFRKKKSIKNQIQPVEFGERMH